jgi:predicted ribonuclease YlaK
MTARTFFLDTSVLIEDPDCIEEFLDKETNTVIITDIVMAELDGAKAHDVRARDAIRNIKHYIDQNRDYFLTKKYWELEGVQIGPGKGYLNFFSNNTVQQGTDDAHPGVLAFEPALSKPNDMGLVQLCKEYSASHNESKIMLITMDTNQASFAILNGIDAEYKKSEYIDPNQLHRDYVTFTDDALYLKILKTSEKNPERRFISLADIDEPWITELIANEFVIYETPEVKQRMARGERISHEHIFRYDILKDALVGIPRDDQVLLDRIRPRNLQQQLILENDRAGVQGLISAGGAGTGKTYLMLALGLHKILQRRRDRGESSSLEFIPRPTLRCFTRYVSVAGEEIGSVPGEAHEKVYDRFSGIATNFPQVINNIKLGQAVGFTLDQAIEMDAAYISIQNIGGLRGASFAPGDVMLIDEGQNLERAVMRTAASRIGHGEIFVLGDTTQWDNEKVDMRDNGLAHFMNAIIQISFYGRGVRREDNKAVNLHFQRRKFNDLSRDDAKKFGSYFGLHFFEHIIRDPKAEFAVKFL